jgi:hypothetical protein
MSELENKDAATEIPPPGERPSGWFAFNERPVMLQLEQPYIGCDYTDHSYGPAMDAEKNVRAVPLLTGILHVEPDGAGGVMLVLQMATGNGNDFALIAVKPKDILYCTHIHQSRIVT